MKPSSPQRLRSVNEGKRQTEYCSNCGTPQSVDTTWTRMGGRTPDGQRGSRLPEMCTGCGRGSLGDPGVVGLSAPPVNPPAAPGAAEADAEKVGNQYLVSQYQPGSGRARSLELDSNRVVGKRTVQTKNAINKLRSSPQRRV